MAMTKALIAVTLAVLAVQASAWSFRSLKQCYPGNINRVPDKPGPNDLNSTSFCFGFQFSATHPADPLGGALSNLFRSSPNTRLNPFALTDVSYPGPNGGLFQQFDSFSVPKPLYYPLDGPYGSGAGGTGYNGSANAVNTVVSRFQGVVAFQLSPFTPGLTYPKVNQLATTLCKWLQLYNPVRGATAVRPGVKDCQVVTWFVRQDPRFAGNANGCRYP